MPTVRELNLAAAILHYILAIGFSSYFAYINNTYQNQPVQGVELTTRSHLLNLSITPTFSAQWNSVKDNVIDLKLVQGMLVSFFIITGSFHLFYYLGNESMEKEEMPSWKNKYTRMLSNKNNYFRWIEYSITSTLMLYIIAFFSGLKDSNCYALLFSTNVSMIATGQMVEEAIRDGKDWQLPMAVGFLLLVFEFAVIAKDFWSRLSQVNNFISSNPSLSNGQSIPPWINAMIIVLFLLFSCFGFLSLWGAYNNEQYETIEKGYIWLSLIAKAVLGVFISYGLGLRQQQQSSWINPTPTPVINATPVRMPYNPSL
jgi:hypothetical protein